MSDSVHLGFEVGTGQPVAIPLRHTVITGQTQEAGKTTTLEALIARAQLPAVAFVTKRGERSFVDGRRHAPYFRERADWQFVESVLAAAMRERMKFERSWIITASKGAATLADVQRNVLKALKTAKGISEGVYTTLNAYLEIVVPRIASVRFAADVELARGVNVFDLSHRDTFPPELQGLVMRSVLEWVYEHANGAITIIPEAWEFLPQGRGSPVKLSAIELVRKGAGLRNYVWLDSQDIGGVDKELLRSCPVWLLGVQREANEIKRTLDNIPAGVAKPRPFDVALLERGQFFACYGRHVIKTYVQPAWMTATEARAIAAGMLKADRALSKPPAIPNGELVYTHSPESEPEDEFMTTEALTKLNRIIELLEAQAVVPSHRATHAAAPAPTAPQHGTTAGPTLVDEEALYQRFKARLATEAPSLLKVLTNVPAIEIAEEIAPVQVDGKSIRGLLAKLIVEGFFEKPQPPGAATTEIKRRGKDALASNVARDMNWLAENGYLTREDEGYRVVAGMKKHIVRA